MAKTFEKLRYQRSRLSKFALENVHCTGIYYLTADMVSHVKTISENKAPCYGQLLAPNMLRSFPNCAFDEKTNLNNIVGFKEPFVCSVQELSMIDGITDKKKAEILTLTKSINMLSTLSDFCATFASVGKLNICFEVDSKGSLGKIPTPTRRTAESYTCLPPPPHLSSLSLVALDRLTR